MKKYKPGQILTYHDTGEVSRVKVIEDNSTAKETSIELEIIEVLRASKIAIESKPGDKFTAIQNNLSGSASCGWHIEEEPEDE